ncbi:MAG: monovalent cation/H(+) antiporter subunit G [Faecalicoccus sp.]|jgi:multicomponent Na+:H+ antiporter subunit G|nr:monovalent cation/H(+) antiporter subunit G [Faecalicoccus sp.]
MSIEWVQFYIVAFILCFGLFAFVCAALGVYRFGFVMNRMHASGIGDSLGLFCIVLAMMIYFGFQFDTIKMVLILVFMWFSSPVSAHFLSQIEYYTNSHLYEFVKRKPYSKKEG